MKASNEKICKEMLEKIDTMYDNLIDYNYLLITGGTGAAWDDIIREYYQGMKNLTVISGEQNDRLSPIFNNVRGYYLYLVEFLRKGGM